MIARLFGPRERIDVACTVEVQHTFECLSAHVVLDGDIAVEPGDEVTVHGAEIRVPYGETAVFRREATVTRAGPLERLWTRLTGDSEFMELCEFSFSERARL